MKNLNNLGVGTDRWFYMLFLPLAWACCSVLHFRHPGDEYAMYAISSLPGSWILFLFPIGDIHTPLIPVNVAVVGALVTASVGLLMAGLSVRKAVWFGLFMISAIVIVWITMGSFPSVARALSKNGSWWAYVCSAVEVGMYCASGLSIVVTGICRLLERLREGRAGGESGWKKSGINQRH